MQDSAPIENHHLHFPHWVVILLLLFVPPIGWWHIWKNHVYHSWFPYLLWLNAAIMLGFAAYVTIHFYPLITKAFDTSTYIFAGHIGLLLLAIFEIIFGFYLMKMFKNKAVLRKRILAIVIALLFLNTVAIPVSQIIINSVVPKKTLQTPTPPTANQDKNIIITGNSVIDETIASFPKTITWQQPVDAKISYTDFSTPNSKQRFISGTSWTGSGTVTSLTDAEAENKTYLKQNGWVIDNNQAADGPTGSVWGYKKTENGKSLILQLSYTNNSITTVPNQPLQIICPCSLSYKVFLSDPF